MFYCLLVYISCFLKFEDFYLFYLFFPIMFVYSEDCKKAVCFLKDLKAPP